MRYLSLFILLTVAAPGAHAQVISKVWSPDNGDGTYKNPIIYADYSDPDICMAGDDFYMTSSSFNSVPALPVLHSRDLVNWELINYAVPEFPDSYYDVPQHGNGVWAPCIRYHEGTFYIFWGDPDRGIYMVKTNDPKGEWSAPVLVKKASGNIDSSPLWDDDGRVYLVHAFAYSRSGIKSTLQVTELSADASEAIDKGAIVFDGHENHPTLEGPKFYKRNGYYYIFAPAGGVPTGWQLILRSRNIYGPYEEKIVLDQGNTPVNGPHQGGLVELKNGESWFVHFQDRGAYGRIVHLQPVRWVDDWPVMGNDPDGDGKGEPVLTYKKPVLPKSAAFNPVESDDFNSEKLGLQWQWNASPQRGWYALAAGKLQMNAQPIPEKSLNLWMQPNILLQKFPAEIFKSTVKLDASQLKDREEAGLVIFGLDYATLTVKKSGDKLNLEQRLGLKAEKGYPETKSASINLEQSVVWLRASVAKDAIVTFSYSTDGKKFMPLGDAFTAKEGKWVGAKTGLFCTRTKETGLGGYAIFDDFDVTK